MSPFRNQDSPTPSLASECAPPPRFKGGRHTRLRVRGWGSPNSDGWRKSLALFVGTAIEINEKCNTRPRSESSYSRWLKVKCGCISAVREGKCYSFILI